MSVETETAPGTASAVTPPARRRRPLRKVLRTIAFHASGTTLSVLWLAPVVLIVITAFRTFDDVAANGIASLPSGGFSIDGFGEAWGRGNLLRAMRNSMIIVVPTVLLSMLLSAAAAYGLSRYRIPFRRTILLIMLAGNLLPPQMIIIPLQKIAEQIGLYDTLTAVIVIQTAFGLGFYTFVLYGFMRSIPFELQDAASIDGAGVMRIFWQIILPLTRPALAALSALCFTWVFNDLLFTITLVISEENLPVTPAVLSLMGMYVSEWNVVAAGTVIAAIPCAIVFFIAQRSFLGGLALGSVK